MYYCVFLIQQGKLEIIILLIPLYYQIVVQQQLQLINQGVKFKVKMLTNTTIKLKRLQKQQMQLKKDPIANVLVKRDGVLDFHFVIHNLDGDYKNGYYHGLLQLHENYPFAAPKLLFYTPSGRFELNMPICTSFTNYHQESWTSAWNVRSLLLGTVSFMTSDEASYGCRSDSAQIKRMYAKNSLQYNLKNPKFCELFLEQIKCMQPSVSTGKQNELQEQQLKRQPIDNETKIVLQNDQQHLIPVPRQPPQQQRNRNKCKKILVGCGILIVIVGSIWLFVSKSK